MPASAATQFTDVNGTEWYAKAVAYCADNGYMSATGANKFDPNGKVSRAQILYNFAERPDMSGAENPFTDVSRNAWYANAVLFAKSTGIVNGTSSTTYSPNNYITREQVAVMLMGYYKTSTETEPVVNLAMLDAYTDKNTVSSWAKDSVAWAIDNRIMSGTGNGKLDPKGTCTRAQLAQFIMNYCQNVSEPVPFEPEDPDNPPIILPDIPGFPEDGNFEPISEDWLPEGGYYQGGRKYNRFGIDITEVDGVPDTNEIQLMAMINNYRVQNGLSKLTWSRYAQVLSEIRACEMAYIMDNDLEITTYGTPHVRPDGSRWSQVVANEDTTTEMIPGNELMFTEFATNAEKAGLSINDMDELMIDSGKIPNTNNPWYETFGENAGQLSYQQTNLASLCFEGWRNSPGHEAAYRRNYDGTQTGYFAVAFKYRINEMYATASYNTYGIEWIDQAEPTPPPVLDPDDGKEWYPGKGIHYELLGFDIRDIPDEYPDWILRDPDMDLESYGPTDHDINSVEHWLMDNGVEEGSDLMYQIKAHYLNAQSMDDYIKFMFSNTEVFHYMNLMPGEWSDITEMWAGDITFMKQTLVSNVADKITYQHMAENNHSDTKCDVCGKNHAEKNDLVSAEQIVNQFFMDTYGFDISAY